MDGLPPLSALYIERPEATRLLISRLESLPEGRQSVIVVSGMGGVGKTQLISKFARDHRERFRVVIFIDASSVQTIRDGLITRLRRLNHRCKTMEEVMDVLATWDEDHSGRWLIIFDNADNSSISLSEFFPSCDCGTIIITTRNQSLGQLAPDAHIELESMTQDEAINLLLSAAIGPHKIYTEAQRKAGTEIADQLGNLPIALMQAGSYIKQRRCLTTFLDRLLNSRPKIFQYPVPPQLDRYKHGTYSMLDIAMKGLPKRARQFLHLLSFAHHSNFPRPLIALAAQHHFVLESCELIERPSTFSFTTQLLHSIFCPGGEWDEDDFDDVVVDLQTASLIVISDDADCMMLSLHPLLRAWAQDQLPTADKDLYRDAMARLLSSGAGPEGVRIHEYLLSHINAMAAHWESLHTNDRASFADLLAFPGIADDTVLIWESVYSEVKHCHGATSTQAYQVALRLAHAYATQGDDKRSEGMYQEATRLNQALEPAAPRSVQDAELKEAPNDMVSTREASKETIAPSSTSAEDLRLLARFHTNEKKEIFNPTCKHCVIKRKRRLSVLLRNISTVTLGDKLEAELAFLGYQNIAPYNGLVMLALTLQSSGELDDCTRVWYRVMDTSADDFLHLAWDSTISELEKKAETYERDGEAARAYTLRNALLKYIQRQSVTNNQEYIVALTQLAINLEMQEKEHEAKPLWSELSAMSPIHDQLPLTILENMETLAIGYEKRKENARARRLREVVLHQERPIQGASSTFTSWTAVFDHVAAYHESQGKLKDVEAFWEYIEEVFYSVQGQENSDMAQITERLVNIYRRRFRFLKAAETKRKPAKVRWKPADVKQKPISPIEWVAERPTIREARKTQVYETILKAINGELEGEGSPELE